MSTFTENYNLIKPDEADYYDVTDFNENMDALDAALAAQETAMAEVSEKIGNPGDSSSDTVFGLLNSGGNSFIKSMQMVDLSFQSDQTVTEEINPVNPAKCFVHMDRLCDASGYISKMIYTLSENSISVKSTTHLTGTAEMYVRFQIIEFY